MSSLYKVLTEDEWRDFQQTRQYGGSQADRSDGFIHLATREQVSGVIERYYSSYSLLIVAKISSEAMAAQLKWEKGKSGDLFPHYYGPTIALEQVEEHWTHKNG